MADGMKRGGVDVGIVAPNVPDRIGEDGMAVFSPIPGNPLVDVLKRAVHDFEPDVLYGITEALADRLVVLAKAQRCRLAFDMHGLGLVEIIELGSGFGRRLPRMKNSLRWLFAMREADLVTVANPTLLGFSRRMYAHVVPILGMTDVSTFSPDGESRHLGTSTNALQILYAGNYYRWQGLDILLEAVSQLARHGVSVQLTVLGAVGKNHATEGSQSVLGTQRNVFYLDTVPYERVPAFYRGADVLVVPRPRMLSTYFALPQKLVDYMSSGRAVVATNLAPHRWALKETRAGVLCPPTAEGVAWGIAESRDSELREECGDAARQTAVRLFDHRVQTARVVDAFERMVKDCR